MSADLTDAQYAAYIDRILECRKAEDEAKEDTKTVYAALADAGGDKTEAGLLVRALRMDEKDAGKAKAREEMLEEARLRYRRGKASHVRAREATQSYTEAKGKPADKIMEGLSEAVAIAKGEAEPYRWHHRGELTDTQEQPETDEPCDCADRAPLGQYWVCPKCDTEWFPEEDNSPSPSSAPRMAADDEATPPAKSSAPLSPDPHSSEVDDGQPQPSANVPPAQKDIGLPDVGQDGTVPTHSSGEFAQQPVSAVQARNEPGSASGASVTLSKPGCLKLKDGHCRISFQTSALCAECNMERMKARAA